ncbi:hypothetical protein L596_012264 [Steinernema carpocapsae]|uniref:Uncharacterized protein n=1 Tax=Steinernema carpocapsae TaxID=34508 RepID=A0A4U5NWL4_STECR|nr:hypothetical protein L596_012264 [Steinernema carpocapsae]
MFKPKPKMSQEASPSLLSPLFEKKPPRAYYPRRQKKAQMEKALLEKSACIEMASNHSLARLTISNSFMVVTNGFVRILCINSCRETI